MTDDGPGARIGGRPARAGASAEALPEARDRGVKGPGIAECWSCGCPSVKREWHAPERMFGWGVDFTYLECARCRSLRIAEVPRDLDRFYPKDYPNFASVHPGGGSRIAMALKRARARHAFAGGDAVGAAVTRLFGPVTLAGLGRLAGEVDLTARILDVGAGNGSWIYHLSELGFTGVSGLDPYIEGDITFPTGATVRRSSLAECGGSWDLVVSHHAFEHMANPLDAMRHMHRLLVPNGVALIRIPIAGTHAWRTYGTSWVAFEAPRHLCLHTEASMAALSDRVGFTVEAVVYDSTDVQFWASEMCLKGIPLVEQRAYAEAHGLAPANRAELRKYRAWAADLNKAGQGDQAAFYLRKR